MKFRKMGTTTLYERQQKRHRLLDSVGEGKGGIFERIALKHIYYYM